MVNLTYLYQPPHQPRSLSHFAYKSIYLYLHPYSKCKNLLDSWNKLPTIITNQKFNWDTEISQDKNMSYALAGDEKLQTWNWSYGCALPHNLYYAFEIYEHIWVAHKKYPDWCEDVMDIQFYRYKRFKLEDLKQYELLDDYERDANAQYICENCFNENNDNLEDSYTTDLYYYKEVSNLDSGVYTKEYYCNFLFSDDYWCCECQHQPLFTMNSLLCKENMISDTDDE
ncbi:Clas92 [Clostera anastomosis granulovirus B]|uniref:Clas92 n=1 Tax=Clostera anastomosis granulovirus B TaxID=1986290 RepID=A0A0K0WS94_9BBAC|nr:Clas92 [Clostera anastomosis granulovirus B]AKS25435.1 Clas92 [Clostera anastomosis granulovirus B]